MAIAVMLSYGDTSTAPAMTSGMTKHRHRGGAGAIGDYWRAAPAY
ncbi:MAG TPA: hypothetical protein VLQ46_00425 [Casimicrobiaceae bacterium]|nr:hypothetical protein [Casimicrobiaceae bacterium]